MPKNTFELLLTAKLQLSEVRGSKSAKKFLALFGEIIWSSGRGQHHQIVKISGQTPKSSENQRFRGRTTKYDFSETTGSWKLKFLPVSDLGQHFHFLTFPSSHYSKMFSYYLPSWMVILPGPELQITKIVDFA